MTDKKLEEAAVQLAEIETVRTMSNPISLTNPYFGSKEQGIFREGYRRGFIRGAKWREENPSDELKQHEEALLREGWEAANERGPATLVHNPDSRYSAFDPEMRGCAWVEGRKTFNSFDAFLKARAK